jgi:phage-related protein
MAKSDVDFTFDTSGFKNGLKQIAGGIANVSRNTINMAKNVSKGVINAAAKIGLLKLAFRGVQSAIKEIPEIGQTFKIAKGIIMKNFLFPVRKAIFPMLQRILDWVRDNRAMFVKWGQTLVTVFRVVSKAVTRVIDIGKGLLKTFGDFFNKTFGTQIKGFNDLLNIISFKFAVAVEFLSRLLKPVMDIVGPIIKVLVENIQKISDPIMRIAGNIVDIVTGLLSVEGTGKGLIDVFTSIVNIMGDIAKFVFEMVDSFVTGLKPTLKPIVNALGEIFEQIEKIVKTIFSGSESIKEWKEIFEWLGGFIGEAILIPLEAIAFAYKGIAESIKVIKNVGGGIGDFFSGNKKKVDDAIIKPDGQVIQTAPEDYIIATKTPGKLTGGKELTVNLDFSGMNINVQEATREEAVRFSESIVDQVRAALNREMEAYGGT